MTEYQVIFSKKAEQDLEEIVKFLELNYPNRIKTDFLVKLSEKLMLLEKMPFMYPVSRQKPMVRCCLINKYVSLYYKITFEKIFLISMKDNRTDPESLII